MTTSAVVSLFPVVFRCFQRRHPTSVYFINIAFWNKSYKPNIAVTRNFAEDQVDSGVFGSSLWLL